MTLLVNKPWNSWGRCMRARTGAAWCVCLSPSSRPRAGCFIMSLPARPWDPNAWRSFSKGAMPRCQAGAPGKTLGSGAAEQTHCHGCCWSHPRSSAVDDCESVSPDLHCGRAGACTYSTLVGRAHGSVEPLDSHRPTDDAHLTAWSSQQAYSSSRRQAERVRRAVLGEDLGPVCRTRRFASSVGCLPRAQDAGQIDPKRTLTPRGRHRRWKAPRRGEARLGRVPWLQIWGE